MGRGADVLLQPAAAARGASDAAASRPGESFECRASESGGFGRGRCGREGAGCGSLADACAVGHVRDAGAITDRRRVRECVAAERCGDCGHVSDLGAAAESCDAGRGAEWHDAEAGRKVGAAGIADSRAGDSATCAEESGAGCCAERADRAWRAHRDAEALGAGGHAGVEVAAVGSAAQERPHRDARAGSWPRECAASDCAAAARCP
jgi:hypothetical protein